MVIALLGYGTVGKAFFEMASERKDIKIKWLLALNAPKDIGCSVTEDFDVIVNDSEVDTVVELIGGLHPAYEYVKKALHAGKNVVTANKWLVATYYRDLVQTAWGNAAALRCTAAAGGGIPWLHSLARILETDKVSRVWGIMNGTSNYILSAMTSQGVSYEAALAEAQRLGYAEADPTADVEGYDARRKLVISANIAFGCCLKEEDVPCQGITQITSSRVSECRNKGKVYKLIAHAEQKADGSVSAAVEPLLFDDNEQEANVKGADNMIALEAGRVGTQAFFGAGAGGYATASNVLADCIEISRGCEPFYVKL